MILHAVPEYNTSILSSNANFISLTRESSIKVNDRETFLLIDHTAAVKVSFRDVFMDTKGFALTMLLNGMEVFFLYQKHQNMLEFNVLQQFNLIRDIFSRNMSTL